MRKGFSLIEMIIVMAVIGILVYTIFLPPFRSLRDESQIVRARKEIETLKLALDSYYKNVGSYPFRPTSNPSISGYGLYVLTSATPQMISKLPENPFFLEETYANGKGAYIYDISYYGQAVPVTYLSPGYSVYYLQSRGPDRTKGTINMQSNVVYVTGDDIVVSNVPVEQVP